MIKGAVDSIESFGLVDGPGIRTVVFLSGCKLRCKYCHNPEMWVKGENNYTSLELVKKILKNKPYFKRNSGGVTFSGGEPLLQIDFLIETCKLLNEENIHIALDTSGVGIGKYVEILACVDLVLLDIKHVTEEGYLDLTGQDIDEFLSFVEVLNASGKEVWIRQVIIPDVNDNYEYMSDLAIFLKKINNIKKVEFLPYHKIGDYKYQQLNLVNPYLEKESMNQEKTDELYNYFLKITDYNKTIN